VTHEDHTASLSFRNLPEVHVLVAGELNAYDVLCSDYLLFTRASLPGAAVVAAEPVPVTSDEAADETAEEESA
jgi:large subunit ribosomal protein L4